MKDQLQDLVRLTSVGFPVIRIEGTDKETKFFGTTNDKTVILEGKFNNVIPEFAGMTLGFSNLDLLASLVGLGSFKDSTVSAVKRGDAIEELLFDSKKSKSTYRLMAEKVLPKKSTFKGTDWHVEIENPTKIAIQEFQQIAGVYSSIESKFIVKTDKESLVFYIGRENAATHKANFVFAEGKFEDMKVGWAWRIQDVLSILKLTDSTKSVLRFSDNGVCQIELDTGVSKVTYTLPGEQ